MWRSRRIPVAGILAVLLISSLPGIATANSVVTWPCNAANNCHAYITQGKTNIPGGQPYDSLTKVTSASVYATATHLCPTSTATSFVNVEIWLVTPPSPSGPAYHASNWQPEWIEYGITRGELRGVLYKSPTFFYATNYWSNTQGRYIYSEYALQNGSLNTRYQLQIRYVTSPNGQWQILRNGAIQVSGIYTQAGPGNNQAMQIGAEGLTASDNVAGQVDTPSYTENGVTYNSMNGLVYTDPSVFTSLTQSSTKLTFSTAHNGSGC